MPTGFVRVLQTSSQGIPGHSDIRSGLFRVCKRVPMEFQSIQPFKVGGGHCETCASRRNACPT
eukprot:388320-Lingulodinium_polyedra.AAC.1